MPIPKPNTGEERDTYISRCISYLADEDPNMPNNQRVAICYSEWNKHEDLKVDDAFHSDFKKILSDFLRQFKDKGIELFNRFIQSYRLDPTKSYSSQITRECLDGFCEAFQWTEPMIKYLKHDDGGRYYKVRALTATVSMNQNDYSDREKIEKSARTLTWRPLNINHDYQRWLPFPDNRVDWAEFEDNSVECIIRIDNKQEDIQQMIESGEIVNPSIEARPIGGTRVEGRFVPEAWNFTGMALLEKDATLPGVPTTLGIEPLFVNEGLARNLVESLSVESTGEEGEMNNTQEAEWTTAYINSLPDSSFAVIEPAYKSGDTENKGARHLPYKDRDGKVDLPHLRNALARMNQLEPVTDSTTAAALRARARQVLIPVAKRELPDSSYAEEDEEHLCNCNEAYLREYWGIQGMSVCGQCKYFTMEAPTNTKEPAIQGGQSDSFNTVSVGRGFNVGVCGVLSRIQNKEANVKSSDWACSDGRPRDTPITVNRSTQNASHHESIDEVEKTAEIIELKKKIADLTEDVTREKQATQVQRDEKAKLSHQLVDLQEQLTELEQSKASDTSKTSRLSIEVSQLREELDKLRDVKADLDIDLKRRDNDIEYYKEQMNKYKEEANTVKDELSQKKAELARVYEKLNDETEKRALTAAENRNSEETKARLQTEISELHVKIGEQLRQISDYAKNNSELAKSRIRDTEELMKLRQEHEALQEELRDTRRQLNSAKKRPQQIKVKL